MQNEFVLLGPAADPAGVRRSGTIRAAFQQCAATASPFLTRGDQSGTHLREVALWRSAGNDPSGPWYQTCARGSMGSLATLRSAETDQAYVLIDRATQFAEWATSRSGQALIAQFGTEQ